RLVGDRVELHVLGDDGLRLGPVLQRHQVPEQLAGVERLAELGPAHRDGDRALLAAVEHARHLALAPHRAGRAGAAVLAHFHVQNDLVGHRHASKCEPPREALPARRKRPAGPRGRKKGAARYTHRPADATARDAASRSPKAGRQVRRRRWRTGAWWWCMRAGGTASGLTSMSIGTAPPEPITTQAPVSFIAC